VLATGIAISLCIPHAAAASWRRHLKL
jgi:hypothetical protein